MSDATERATEVIGEVSGLSAEECEEIAAALERADLLATALVGEVDISAAQEWVMIPADQVHEEWAIGKHEDNLIERWGGERLRSLEAAEYMAEVREMSERVFSRFRTGWEPVDRFEDDHGQRLDPIAGNPAVSRVLESADLSITVHRAEGDAMNRQNTVVLARDVAAAEAAGYPRHRWCVVTPRNIKIGPRGMQARYAVAVDLTDGELTEMLVHDSVAPAFLWAGDAEVVRVTTGGDGKADQ